MLPISQQLQVDPPIIDSNTQEHSF